MSEARGDPFPSYYRVVVVIWQVPISDSYTDKIRRKSLVGESAGNLGRGKSFLFGYAQYYGRLMVPPARSTTQRYRNPTVNGQGSDRFPSRSFECFSNTGCLFK